MVKSERKILEKFLNICVLEPKKRVLGIQKRVQISQGIRAIGV